MNRFASRNYLILGLTFNSLSTSLLTLYWLSMYLMITYVGWSSHYPCVSIVEHKDSSLTQTIISINTYLISSLSSPYISMPVRFCRVWVCPITLYWNFRFDTFLKTVSQPDIPNLIFFCLAVYLISNDIDNLEGSFITDFIILWIPCVNFLLFWSSRFLLAICIWC